MGNNLVGVETNWPSYFIKIWAQDYHHWVFQGPVEYFTGLTLPLPIQYRYNEKVFANNICIFYFHRENEIRVDMTISPIEETYALLNKYNIFFNDGNAERVDTLSYGWKKLIAQVGYFCLFELNEKSS